MDHRFESEQGESKRHSLPSIKTAADTNPDLALKLDPVLPKTMPILLVATSEKFATDERIDMTREFVPSMEVVRLNGCNHFAMLEQPKEVTQVIGDWIEKQLKEN